MVIMSASILLRVLCLRISFSTAFFFVLLPFAQAEKDYSPYIDQTYPSQVYWGDTHLHTNLSIDAYAYGNKKLGPEDAYRFAKGSIVKTHNGMEVRLRRPLDFIVIADHALNMGVMQGIETGNSELLATKSVTRWSKLLDEINISQLQSKPFNYIDPRSMAIFGDQYGNNVSSPAFTRSLWQRLTSLADKHNAPGNFTALIGYEWTSESPAPIHRVVIFKDGAQKVSQIIPFSIFDSEDPEDLWEFLENYEKNTGGEVLAIPHNGNLTNGHMFKLKDSYGKPFTQDYAKIRSRWEPLLEVTQIKGDSETHPFLSPDDKFSDYETWEGYNPSLAKDEEHQYEYARSALKLGLSEQARLEVNPFKFGMIGSTDAHTSLSAVEEDNFMGKTTAVEPRPGRIGTILVGLPSRKNTRQGWTYASSGYAAIWAKENTRESLFAAMKRKEVYASTGPRITVRFFGGWSYENDDAIRSDITQIGYTKGVPMGGDLTNAPKGKTPSFLIRALKDPDGANLDRVQVIKGWRDSSGELHEKVYDVALSDDRKVRWNGKVKPVGSTVDINDASYTNTIGDPELATVWLDPSFNKDELAFYYLRVLEIPTPRWTAYDAKYFGLTDIPKDVPMLTQERAYTSPIWYAP